MDGSSISISTSGIFRITYLHLGKQEAQSIYESQRSSPHQTYDCQLDLMAKRYINLSKQDQHLEFNDQMGSISDLNTAALVKGIRHS